jgi:hypothetical protein
LATFTPSFCRFDHQGFASFISSSTPAIRFCMISPMFLLRGVRVYFLRPSRTNITSF